MEPELRAHLDSLATMMDDMRAELMQELADTRRHTEQLNLGTRREMGERIDGNWRATRVLIEDVQAGVRVVADGVSTVNAKLDRITEDHERRIQQIEQRIP